MRDGGLVLVGAGRMGFALLSGWLDQAGSGGGITVLEPHVSDPLRELASAHEVRLNPPVDEIASADAVVLAVKPQVMGEVLGGLAALTRLSPVFLSIAAGCTIETFASHLGADMAIVRAMPNTPAAIGRGITVACANNNVSAAQRALCTGLLEAVGKTAWLEDESLMDAVTAVSGSGPAYVFLLAECLFAAGLAEGLPRDLAAQLATETVAGAGALLDQSDETPETLRKNVTSPGGTTAAALEVLRGHPGLEDLMVRAVHAATERSRELAE
jgi:pyrroline-5-carboxylate reductase